MPGAFSLSYKSEARPPRQNGTAAASWECKRQSLSGCWGLCLFLCSVCSGALVDLALVIHREQDDQNGHNGKDHGNGRGGDGKEVAALDVHVTHEVLLAHGSQNEGQQNGRQGELVLVHQPADDAEGDTDAHVKGILVDGESTQQGDDQNDGVMLSTIPITLKL